MSDFEWKRTEFNTWDEAFRGQVAAVRQQSVRVASYTQAIFLQACADNFAAHTPNGEDQIRTQYGDLAYKCGLYHQLGKALVPPEYQLWQADFSEEEIAVYRKYTTDGRTLVANLQERGQWAFERRRGLAVETPTKNIPWQMIRESCQQHMERWDGSGYPDGRAGNDISPIAQIVGLAKELDRLTSETRGETPFDDAFELLVSQKDTYWSPELIQVLTKAKTKCRAVYKKYIHYTMTVPKTIPLVERTKDRPMGLTYRPMVNDKEGTVVAFEATPWFGAISKRPGEKESVEEVQEMLARTGIIVDMMFYFLYEAADTLLRLQNNKIETEGILLHTLPGFFTSGTQLARFNELFDDQPIEKCKLMLTLPEDVFLKCSKTNREIIGRYARNGVALVLDNYHPENLDYLELLELGITHVRFAPELYLKQETAETMMKLQEQGFSILGGGANTYDLLAWQVACGMKAISGALSGIPVSEDDLIRDCLAREQ